MDPKDERLSTIIKCTLDGKSTRETLSILMDRFGSGYGDASSLNITRVTRRVVKVLREMGAISTKFTTKRTQTKETRREPASDSP